MNRLLLVSRRAVAKLFAVSLLVLSSVACATVPAWQRGRLASRVMRAPFGDPRTEADYRDKVVQSRSAGMLPPGTPGGGCGCTQ